MMLRVCAHLMPLPGHLVGRTLTLCLDDLPSNHSLQAKHAPNVGAMAGQRLEVGPLAIDEVEYQEPAKDQLMPMAETGPQDPQTLQHTAGQTGQACGPGLLGDTRFDGHLRSRILGGAWPVEDLHA
jgi:hypothetical protein